MKKFIAILVLLSCTLGTYAQRSGSVLVSSKRANVEQRDTMPVTGKSTPIERRDSVAAKSWKPNAERSIWMGVLFPGMGQIYNRSYWKLPVVYGGFMGCGFAIGMNQGKYDRYKQAYRDLYTARQLHGESVPESEDLSYMKVVPKGYTIERLGGASAYLETLNNWQNSYRRYRDFSILATIVVYGLSIIDAYVDARLYDFDISPDLSMHAEPALYVDPFNNRAVEARVALTLK